MEISTQPLARRMRPKTLEGFVGQRHLLDPGKPLNLAITQAKLHSMILWGPPGVGKTALAELITSSSNARIERLSAVLDGVKEIRAVMQRAQQDLLSEPTVLFVDEVHRFNKAQQDAFLPHIEQGTVTFIGATTENPSFHLNNALLSRTRVYVLQPLNDDDLLQLIENTLQSDISFFADYAVDFAPELRKKIVVASDGDARTCLNMLEILFDFADLAEENKIVIDSELVDTVLTQTLRRLDKGGDLFYDQISALHKAIRGSDPDASLYWFARMLDSGCDPNYIARRLVRVASEDVGNADPRALEITLNAWQAFERLGSPEGELALGQAVIFLACAAKSNASYLAFNQAMTDAKELGQLPVPMHLRNAPTGLMKDLGYGKKYRYAHDEKDAIAKGEYYFPEKIKHKVYYKPVDRGLEIKIAEKLAKLRSSL